MKSYIKTLFNKLNISYKIPCNQEIIKINSNNNTLIIKDKGVDIK